MNDKNLNLKEEFELAMKEFAKIKHTEAELKIMKEEENKAFAEYEEALRIDMGLSYDHAVTEEDWQNWFNYLDNN